MTLPDYLKWGLAETNNAKESIRIQAMTREGQYKVISLLSSYVDLQGFTLKKMAMVSHYQGKLLPAINLGIIRFERDDGKNNGIGGEHISVAVNLETMQLFGFTRMLKHLSDDGVVSHKQALDKAVTFLHKVAPDLIPTKVVLPNLVSENNLKMEFKPAQKIGGVELQWINGHKEEIFVDNKKISVYGMKVKMYLPATKLWAWVIIDKEGNVLTFERNIFWNFDKYQRETQMWLHDKWLEAHQITLFEV